MARTGCLKVDEHKDKRVSMRINKKDYLQIMEYAEMHELTVAELIKKNFGNIYVIR